MPQGTRSIKKAVCNLCFNRCGINAHVRDGKIYRVTPMKGHPLNRLCPKAKGLIDWVYSPERITHPMKKIKGQWKEVSWDEALSFISDKLFSIKDKYGAKSAVVFSGIAFAGIYDVRAVIGRWGHLFGTPNLTTGATYCYRSHVIGHSLTLDYGGAHLRSDLVNSKCIINWGRNPEASKLVSAIEIAEARKRGAKLIVIDPRVTKTARKADIHAQIKPGTDCALALGILNVVIEEELYDKEFVDKYTTGFDRLAIHLKQFTPEKVADITWVSADIIRKIARIYATTKPATITQDVSVDHAINGVQASRAIAILIAITDNLDVSGGNRICPLLKFAKLDIGEKPQPRQKDSIGTAYPIFSKFTGHPTSTMLIDTILTEKPYPIKALIVDGANPALTWPNSNKVRQALSKLELLVTVDLFMTETAKMADVFLPASTNLESKFLAVYSSTAQLPYIIRTEPVIKSLGESLPDWKIWTELGRKMFGDEYFHWEDADEIYKAHLYGTPVTVDRLKQNPEGLFYSQWQEKEYLKEGFDTPSRKVEIYSNLLEKSGQDPLPTCREPSQTYVNPVEYPFIAMTGPRTAVFTHSQFRNIPVLLQKEPEPRMEINTETARDTGISDGDFVQVKSPAGTIKIKAVVTDNIHPRVICIPHGWSGEANANLLTNDTLRDPISGYPPFRSVPCRVIKKS